MKKQKRFTKRTYVYLAFVTMAAVSLFAKPIKRGLNALTRRLKNASAKKASLRESLNLYTDSAREQKYVLSDKKSKK